MSELLQPVTRKLPSDIELMQQEKLVEVKVKRFLCHVSVRLRLVVYHLIEALAELLDLQI